LQPHLDSKVRHNPFFLSAILVLVATGFGAFNEIIELLGVVFFQAADGVGTYTNNAVDLVYNTIGAILASIIVVKYHRRLIDRKNGPARGVIGLIVDKITKTGMKKKRKYK